MIVRITSCAPVRALMNPTRKPQNAPPTMPAMTASGRWIARGRWKEKPTQPAAAAPARIWPWPPMLNMPARNDRATPRPATISGMAKFSVSNSGEIAPANVDAWKSMTAPWKIDE